MASFRKQFGISIQNAFDIYHEANPHVFQYFCKYAHDLVEAERINFKKPEDIRVSAKLIINRIRWEVAVNSEIRRKFGDFKINDAFHSRYARLFQEQHPSWAHIFETRRLRA